MTLHGANFKFMKMTRLGAGIHLILKCTFAFMSVYALLTYGAELEKGEMKSCLDCALLMPVSPLVRYPNFESWRKQNGSTQRSF